MLVSSDSHSGSWWGLNAPGYFGGPMRVKMLQYKLWRWWRDETRRIGPVNKYVINGDAVDGPGRKDTTEQITTDMDEQVENSTKVHKIVQADEVFMTFGSPYHVKGDSKWEKPVAAALGASIKPIQRIQLGPVTFNFKHHQPRSDTPSGQFHQTYKVMVREMLRAEMNGYGSADVTVRSHVHYYTKIETRFKTAISTPCLEYPFGSYGWKLDPMLYDMGFLLIEVDEETGEFFVRRRFVPLEFYVEELQNAA